MSELKRLENQLEQLERSYKLGIISEDEYNRGKSNLEKKIKPLKDQQKKTEESKKIIDEVLSSEKKDTKSTKKAPKEGTKKKTTEPKKSETKKHDSNKPETKKDESKKSETKKDESKKSETKKTEPKATEPKKTKKKEKTGPSEPAKERKTKTDFNGSIWAGLLIILVVVVVFFLFAGPEETTLDKTVGEKNLTGVNETVNVFFYSSYSCQYCLDTNEVLKNIDKAYGDNVNVVRVHYPYNIEIDLQMDIASECAKGQAMYENFSTMLYDADKPVSEDELISMAQELNITGFETCLKNQETAEDVLKEYQGAIQRGIDKVPTVSIDGAKIVGVKPAVIYETIIDDELNID